MKTACEINHIATAFALERETHERALAEKYAEEVVAPIIEKDAKEGHVYSILDKDSGINFKFLRSYLENHGYKVEGRNPRIYKVKW